MEVQRAITAEDTSSIAQEGALNGKHTLRTRENAVAMRTDVHRPHLLVVWMERVKHRSHPSWSMERLGFCLKVPRRMSQHGDHFFREKNWHD